MGALRDLKFPAVERRAFAFDDFEMREADGGLRFDGIAAVTDSWTELQSGFFERIAKGAFRKFLTGGHDVRFLVDHDPSKVLARSTVTEGPGSLILKEEARGLRAQAVFSDTTLARDTAQLIRDGVVSQMSFAWPYGSTRDNIEEVGRGVERTIKEFTSLRDVSAVTFPAYSTTTASMRSLECGFDMDDEELRRLASDVHDGHVIVTDDERRLIDEAFASREMLSPWMTELARKALGVPFEPRMADQEAEGSVSPEAPVGEPTVSAAARTRRLSLKTRELHGRT